MTEEIRSKYQSIIQDAAHHVAVNEIEEQIFRAIMQHQEFFAAAFIAETGLRPSECEMVIQGNSITFRRRQRSESFTRFAPVDASSFDVEKYA